MKMEFDLNALVRPNVLKMKPYASARDEFKDFNNEMIFLDANENPNENGLNRYPDPQQIELKNLLSKIKSVDQNQILLGNGSDEILDLIFRAFCEPKKDNIVILPPTYGMYKVLAEINDIRVTEVLLSEDFQPKVREIIESQDDQSKLLILCSPNNPTSNSFNNKFVEKLIREFKGVVLIDEAYIDFSNEQSWTKRLVEFPNLIITQTLSKAYGMAGIRLGICFASPNIISILNKIKPPYNVNQLTQSKALERLIDKEIVEFQVKEILVERETLIDKLKLVSFIEQVFPSDANFLLVKVDDATKRYQQLISKGIVIRNRTNEPLCSNCLRFTVGTPNENKNLIKVLATLQ